MTGPDQIVEIDENAKVSQDFIENAKVSQDGMLRVLHWDTMELVGSARSYFGENSTFCNGLQR